MLLIDRHWLRSESWCRLRHQGRLGPPNDVSDARPVRQPALIKTLAFDRFSRAIVRPPPTTFAAGIWLIAWAVLHRRWKGRQLDPSRVYVATLVLVAVGTVFCFPPVWRVFG